MISQLPRLAMEQCLARWEIMLDDTYTYEEVLIIFLKVCMEEHRYREFLPSWQVIIEETYGRYCNLGKIEM